MADLRDNPFAVPGADAPRIEQVSVQGTTLYAEVRGSGRPILLIPGGGEDAEGWRPVAERIPGRTVVTYDRRGTLRSGRGDWPGKGSAQHADDAAALLTALGLTDSVVVGGSSGGIVAIQLALRHPTLVRRALIYEPGYFRVVPHGPAFQQPVNDAVRAYLDAHPADWAEAYAAFSDTVTSIAPPAMGPALAAPPGLGWYDRREQANAEALIRDDILILTTEDLDAAALIRSSVEMRFAYGDRSLTIFRDIVGHLASLRGGDPDILEGGGHVLYFRPETAARYVSAHAD